MAELNRRIAEAAARIAAANGWTPEDVGGPVDVDGIIAARREPRPYVTHGTAAELVMDRIRAGEADTVPSGLLEMAGLTRDGADAADWRLGKAMEAAGVPEAFRDLPPDLTRNAQLGGEEPRGLWLSGDVGRGKTTAACRVLRGWLSEHPLDSALFDTEDGMLGAVKGAFDHHIDAELVLDRYVGCSLLVLDDMGKARLSAWGASQVFRVVDGRWRKRLPTIFTSQHALPEWGALMAQAGGPTAKAMVSRIAGTCDQLVFTGKDRRLA